MKRLVCVVLCFLAITGFSWRGLKQVVIDQFDGGSDVELSTTGDWTQVVGTATIREDGAGTAYSKSVGSNVTASYSNTVNGIVNNRKVECDVEVLGTNVHCGIFVTHSGSLADKGSFKVYGVWNGVNTDYYYQPIAIAPPAATLIGQISGSGQHHIRADLNGQVYTVSINNGTLTASFDGGGTNYGNKNDRAGLYYKGPSLGAGTVILAEWQNFDVRLYPYN